MELLRWLFWHFLAFIMVAAFIIAAAYCIWLAMMGTPDLWLLALVIVCLGVFLYALAVTMLGPAP